jgi:DNA polymerase
VTRLLAEVAAEASTCTRCKLAVGRTQVVFGVGAPEADLMFIGEGPGFHEDRQGEPFVGAAGQLLTRLLGEIGLERGDVYIANVVKCRPPGNRDPEPDEIEACTPWLVEQISLIQPRVIVTLGNFATKFVLQTTTGITRLRGQVHEWHGRTVIPTFHPAAILHGGGERSPQFAALRDDFELVRRTLETAPEPASPATPAASEPATPGTPAAPVPAAAAVPPAPPEPAPGALPRVVPGVPDGPRPDPDQMELF